jgi:hypothetical protein
VRTGVDYGLYQSRRAQSGHIIPVMLDYLVPADHICRVVDAFVEQLDMENPEFGRAEPLIRVGLATILAIC